MTRRRASTGLGRIKAALTYFVLLVDVAVSVGCAITVVRDRAVLSCHGDGGGTATCAFAEDYWFVTRTRVYGHVTGVAAVSLEGSESTEYGVRLTDGSGRIGPSSLAGDLGSEESAARYATYLDGLVAGAGEQGFSEEVRVREPLWLQAIFLPLLSVCFGILAVMLSTPLVSVLDPVSELLAAVILPPARVAERCWRWLLALGRGIRVALIARRIRRRLRRRGLDPAWVSARLRRLPVGTRSDLGRRLVSGRGVSPGLLEAVHDAQHDDPAAQAPIAFHPDVSAALRERILAGSAAEAVAAHPEVPVELLGRLAGDGREAVRQAVARNGATPADVLADLALDRVEAVRAAAAANPGASTEVKALAWFLN